MARSSPAHGRTKTTSRAASRPTARRTARKAPAAGGRRKAAAKSARSSSTRAAARQVARAKPAKSAKAAAKGPPTPRPGMIAHTEFVSTDADATKRFLEQGLGLSFLPPMQMPDGPYHMWSADNRTGGGIRGLAPGESAGAIPYIEVKAIHDGFRAAVQAGATEIMGPMAIQGSHGWMAIVRAPGGPMVGLWSNR